MVDEALLTNSPLSFNQDSRDLLSSPSSFASSWTRALPGTVLLRMPGKVPGLGLLLHGRTQLPAHESWLIECSRLLDLLSDRRVELREVHRYRCDVERTWDPEGPWERSAPIGKIDTHLIGVHGGASTRQVTGLVNGEDTVSHDDTQQGGLRRMSPATHASAHRAHQASRCQLYRASRPLLAGWTTAPTHPTDGPVTLPLGAATSVSLWMSIRHVVRRAARRAFWPSLPMANDNL